MDNSKIYFIENENYSRIPDYFLRQIAILRWGYDENKLDSWANRLKSDTFGFTSFYMLASPDLDFTKQSSKIIGFAYFCQDENNENYWYYGDLIIHSEYRRSGIATRMIETGMIELKCRKASKLFTYIDKDNESSILLHEKLSFIPSAKQGVINGFDKNDRIIYELTL